MTLEVHVAELRAVDRMSATMKGIGGEARQLGQTISQSMDQASSATRRFSFDRAAMATGLRELQGVASDFARSALEETAGQERLQTAISNTGRSYDDVSKRVENLIKVGTDLSFADDQVVEGLTRLTNTTGDVNIAMDNLGLAMDLARAKHIDLAAASEIVGKVAAGNTSILSRYGIIVEEGASSVEALALMQARFANQAETYGASTQGFIDRLSNSIADFGETLFSQNQELQLFLSLMPGVNAAYSVLAGAVAGLGGVGSVARLAGPAALIAGGASLAYGYSQNDLGTTQTNAFWNNFFMQGSSVMNALLPGNPYSTQKYADQMEANRTGDVLNAFFNTGGDTPDTVIARANYVLGNPGMAETGRNMNADQLKAFIIQQSAALGMSPSQYVEGVIFNNPNAVRDPLTGAVMGASEYSAYSNTRYFDQGGNLTSGAFTMGYGALANGRDPYGGRGAFAPPGIDYGLQFPTNQGGSLPRPGGAGVAANSGLANYNAPVVLSPEMQSAADATALKNYNAALKEQVGVYYPLIEGINSASDAQKMFKATQDGLLQQSSVFQAQQSEYGGVLSDMEAGYAILQRRQAEGIELSAREQEFMQSYVTNSERMTGAVEDAVVEQALLGGEYAANVTKGDELNRSLAGNTDATSALVDIIYELILSMDGVPEEVRSRITIERANESLVELQGIRDYLNGLNGFTANAYVNVTRTGIAIGSPDGVGISLNGLQLGGMIPAAQHGRVLGGGYVLVGESGPELIAGGQGGMVIPASATRARRQGGMGGGTVIQHMTVIANDPMEFASAMQSRGLSEAADW